MNLERQAGKRMHRNSEAINNEVRSYSEFNEKPLEL